MDADSRLLSNFGFGNNLFSQEAKSPKAKQMKKYLIVILLSGLILAFTYLFQSQTLADKRLHVIICDVGQGDGIYIRTSGNVDIVIDGGPANGKMLKCLAKYMPFWDHDIELMFATHPDADHISGLVDILKNYKVDAFYTSTDENKNKTHVFENLKSEVAAQNLPFKLIVTGDKFTLTDGTTLTTLWPKAGFSDPNTNPYSLVQVLQYGNFHALFTGDITYQILDTLNFQTSFDVFKIPHHGSNTGVDDTTFHKIHAYFVPISVGLNNRYHHPHPSVLALLNKYHVPYLRTDQVGTIEIVTDGKNTKVVK